MDTINIRHTCPYMYTKPRFFQSMFYVCVSSTCRICMKTQVQFGRRNDASLNDWNIDGCLIDSHHHCWNITCNF